MEKILILGGTGNIGFPVIQYLVKQKNVKVVAGVHDIQSAKIKFKEYPNVELRAFDFLNQSTFNDALGGIDKLFFVRPPQLSKPKEDMLPFLKIVKEHNLKQVVFVSLIGVEKNPMTPHNKIEKMIVELELPYTFIRPSFFMQNLNTTHQEDIQKNSDLFIPAGKAKTSFIDTRDIGEIAGRCLSHDAYIGQKIDVTGSQALTYKEISEIMSLELGRTITYSKPSLLFFRKTMIKRGTPKAYANVMTMLYLITQLGNAKKITNTAESILGRPPITFKEYAHDYRNYFLTT